MPVTRPVASVRLRHGAGGSITSTRETVDRALAAHAARLRGYFDAFPNPDGPDGLRPWRVTFGNGTYADVTLREGALLAAALASAHYHHADALDAADAGVSG